MRAPPWCTKPKYFLKHVYWPEDVGHLGRMLFIAESPTSFRHRFIFTERSSLRRKHGPVSRRSESTLATDDFQRWFRETFGADPEPPRGQHDDDYHQINALLDLVGAEADEPYIWSDECMSIAESLKVFGTYLNGAVPKQPHEHQIQSRPYDRLAIFVVKEICAKWNTVW